MTALRALLICFLAAAAGGCRSGRLADLRDCGRLSAGVGLGLSADVKIGDMSHPSLGIAAYTYRIGFENRNIAGVWTEGECAFPVVEIPNLMGPGDHFFMSYSRDLFAEGHDATLNSMHAVGFWLPFERAKVGDRLRQSAFNTATDIQAGITLGFISARAGINPLEIADFLLGFVGLDIAGDDA
jgi:hypothetical protein